MIDLEKKSQELNQQEVDNNVKAIYAYATGLIVNGDYTHEQAKQALIQQGINDSDA